MRLTGALQPFSDLRVIVAVQKAVIVGHLEGSARRVGAHPTDFNLSALAGVLYRDDPAESVMGGGVRLLADGAVKGYIRAKETHGYEDYSFIFILIMKGKSLAVAL